MLTTSLNCNFSVENLDKPLFARIIADFMDEITAKRASRHDVSARVAIGTSFEPEVITVQVGRH
jgi:hypothetical protein